MTARKKTIETPRSEARLYMRKAQQFSDEAIAAIKSSRNDAALLNAVHAVISAADAVCVALGGRRSSDPDHQRAADLLHGVGGRSKSIAGHVSQLRMLLAKKNLVEYESRQTTTKEASEAVRKAERFVSWAQQTVEDARL